MVVTCDIEFENNPAATFYAGQAITGKITLKADKIKQIKAVSLKVSGSANTRWIKKHSRNRSTTYWGKVDYIKSLTHLLAANASDQFIVIEPGIHTFSFACSIPENCPSSYEGCNGEIRYTIQVNLVRPWKFDESFTRAFTVLSIRDLNFYGTLLKLPVNTTISKVFCCGPCRSDALQMAIQLPQTGYVPGQLIPVSIIVSNETQARINEMCVRLVMVVTLFSTHPRRDTKSETITVSKLIGDPVLRHCKKHFNYLLPIPATPPTCTTLCSLIQIAYRIEVEAKLQGVMYANQAIHTPVTIGSVPLQMSGMVVVQQPRPSQLNWTDNARFIYTIDNNNDPNTSNRNVEPWSAVADISPPVYMEAVHMPQAKLSEDSVHDYCEKNFTPKYPVFNIPSPTSLQPPLTDETGGPVLPPTDPDKTTWL